VKEFQREAPPISDSDDPAEYQAQVEQAEAGVAAAQGKPSTNSKTRSRCNTGPSHKRRAAECPRRRKRYDARQEPGAAAVADPEPKPARGKKLETGHRRLCPRPGRQWGRASLIAAQRHPLEVRTGTTKQRAADVLGAKARVVTAAQSSATQNSRTVRRRRRRRQVSPAIRQCRRNLINVCRCRTSMSSPTTGDAA